MTSAEAAGLLASGLLPPDISRFRLAGPPAYSAAVAAAAVLAERDGVLLGCDLPAGDATGSCAQGWAPCWLQRQLKREALRPVLQAGCSQRKEGSPHCSLGAVVRYLAADDGGEPQLRRGRGGALGGGAHVALVGVVVKGVEEVGVRLGLLVLAPLVQLHLIGGL